MEGKGREERERRGVEKDGDGGEEGEQREEKEEEKEGGKEGETFLFGVLSAAPRTTMRQLSGAVYNSPCRLCTRAAPHRSPAMAVGPEQFHSAATRA